mgnify:CR=1 FL=1
MMSMASNLPFPPDPAAAFALRGRLLAVGGREHLLWLTIHHIAFRAETQEDQHAWQDALLSFGHRTTPVIDRQYFNAIYFREPGGVLFEIATDPPGFAVDEPVETMGSQLMLPAQHERLRDRIEAKGVGYLAPRASNLTPEGQTQNRRVEVMVTSTELLER